MGDRRFERSYHAVAMAADRQAAIRDLDDEGVIEALAAASRESDPLLANVLATEASNRMRRLRASLAHLPEGVVSLDEASRVQWLNPRAEWLLNVERDQAIGVELHQLVEHRDAKRDLIAHEACPLLQAPMMGHPISREGEHFVRSDGTFLCVSYTCAPVRTPEGEASGAVLIFNDCAAARDRDLLGNEARIRFESLFQNLPLGVVSLDPNGTIVAVNEAATKVAGYPAHEARGHSFLAFLHPDDMDAMQHLFQKVLQGQGVNARARLRSKDGALVEVRASGIPIVDGDRVAGVHCLFEPVEADAARRIQIGE